MISGKNWFSAELMRCGMHVAVVVVNRSAHYLLQKEWLATA